MSTEHKKGGRPKKLGLDYYPLYATLFDSKKMRLAEDLIDPTGRNNIDRLLMDKFVTRFFSTIFLRGYYMPWNDEEEQEMCKNIGNGMNAKFLRPFLIAMLESGILSKDLYQRHHILTSRGIQQKWLKISKLIRRDKPTIEEQYFIQSDKNEFLRDGKPVSSRRNHNNLQKKPSNNTKSTAINNQNIDNKQVISEQTPVSSVGNPNSLLEETGVSLSTTTTNSILGDTGNVVVDQKVREETLVSSVSNANNSQFVTENTNNGGSKVPKEGEFLTEEIGDTSRRNPMIPSGSREVYPLEVCSWNYLYNNAYQKAREQHQINWGTLWDHDTLERWVSAFNRFCIAEGYSERQFNGTDGWLKHLRFWVPKTGDYKTLNPDDLLTDKDLKNNGNQQQRGKHNGPHNGQQQPGAAERIGGVKADQAANLLSRKK